MTIRSMNFAVHWKRRGSVSNSMARKLLGFAATSASSGSRPRSIHRRWHPTACRKAQPNRNRWLGTSVLAVWQGLLNPRVSKRHCLIVFVPSNCYIASLCSKLEYVKRMKAPLVMGQFSARRSSTWIAATLVVGLGSACPGRATQIDKTTKFLIVSHPLAGALDIYSRLSGVEVAYDGALVAGRWSHSVDGLWAPDEALRQLLIDTGLSARITGQTSFTVAPATQPAIADASERTYFASVQYNVAQVLCAFPETRPHDIDIILQLWVDRAGRVQRAELLDTPPHERAFVAELQGVRIGEPPLNLPQPITVAILARSGDQLTGCSPILTTVTH